MIPGFFSEVVVVRKNGVVEDILVNDQSIIDWGVTVVSTEIRGDEFPRVTLELEATLVEVMK